MLWRTPYWIRGVKNLYFGLLWGLTFFLLYQTMVSYRLQTVDQNATDSPATLAETIIKSCTQYGKQEMQTLPHSGYVAVLGRRSPKTAELVRTLLQSGSGVLLVSDPDIFDNLKLHLLSPNVKDIKLKFVNIQGSCQQLVLEEVFKTYTVSQLHILFDEFDFSPVEFHKDISAIFRCLIHVFETIARNHDTPIFIHATRGRHVPSYKHVMQYQPIPVEPRDSRGISWDHAGLHKINLPPLSSPTKESRVAQNHRINSCDPLYNYDFYHDVFMKSVSIYTTTYRNLYDLKVQNVVY